MAGSYKSDGREVQSFLNGIISSSRRYRRNIDAIVAKYDRPFANDDLIDLSTMSISRNCGRLLRNPPIEMGKADLKSTKHKEELSLKQMQPGNEQNPNVSMAIARKCASILETSRQVDEEDVSDAETIGSEYSENCEEDEDDDDDDCRDSGEDYNEDIQQEESINNREDREIGGKIDKKQISTGKYSRDQQFGKKGRNKMKKNEISSDTDEEDNIQTVLLSNDFQEDFHELTKNTRFKEDAYLSPDRNNVDAGTIRLPASTSPIKKSSFKSLSNVAEFSMQNASRMNQPKGRKAGVQRDAETSFTSSVGNTSVLGKGKSITDRQHHQPSNDANLTAESFNMSVAGKQWMRSLDISSIRNESFGIPAADDLSFVSISSPVKQVNYKSKSSDRRKQNHLGDTYVIDDLVSDTRKTSQNKEQCSLNNCNEGVSQSGHHMPDQYKTKSEATIRNLKIDVTPSKSPATPTEQPKPFSSVQNVSSCLTPVPTEVFKSPHGIKIRRVRPKQLSVNLSDVSQDWDLAGKENTGIPSSPCRAGKASFLASHSWEKCDSIISSISTVSRGNECQPPRYLENIETKYVSGSDNIASKVTGSHQHLRRESNDFKTKTNMIPIDITFTSTDESERPWSKACELAMRSPTKRTIHSNSCSPGKKPDAMVWTSPIKQNILFNATPYKSRRIGHQTSLDNVSTSKSSKLNVSLTRSFKNMDLYPNQSPVKNSRHNSCNNLKHAIAVAPQKNSCKVDEKVCRFNSLKKDRTFTQLTPSQPNTLPKHPTFLPDSSSMIGRYSGMCTESMLKTAGFDPLKWTSKETLQPRAQGACAMKRKIPASFTSGYCSQTSPSLLDVRHKVGQFVSKDDFKNKNRESTNHPVPSKSCHQKENSCVCSPSSVPPPAYVFGTTAGFKDVHTRSTFTPIRPNVSIERKTCPLSSESFGNKQTKCRQSLPRQTSSEKASVNPFLLSPPGQQESSPSRIASACGNKAQMFYNMDNSHVLQWLEASRKHYNSPETFSSRSSPSNFINSYQNKATITNRSQEIQTEAPSKHRRDQSLAVFNSHEKRDIGVQVSLDASHLQSPSQCCLSHQTHCHCCSCRNDSHWPSTFMQHPFCSPAKPAFSNCPTSSLYHTHNGETNHRMTQSCLSTPLIHSPQKSISVANQGSLNTRAMAVWREIQAEKTVEESFPSDFSVIESETSPSASTSLNEEPIIAGDNDENHFADDEEVVDETVEEQEPRRHSTLLDDLNKMFGGNLQNKSFVETQNARHKSQVENKNLRNGSFTVPRKPQHTSKNIMFPMSYINEFSPNNPARRDSDMAMYKYEQQLIASAPSLKSTLKSFKPLRNQHHVPKPSTNYTKVAQRSSVSPVEGLNMERPMKFRKITKLSPPQTKLKSPVDRDQRRLNTQSSYPSQTKGFASFINKNQGSHLTAINDSCPNQLSPRTKDRVSTPVKKTVPHPMPELDLEETLSTIISPTAGIENLERTPTPQVSILFLDGSYSQSDSDEEVSLL